LNHELQIYEIVSGFVAAGAVGIAGEFASDKTVPPWLLAVLFFGGIGLWAAAVTWLFLAHRRLANKAAGHKVRHGPGNVESRLWRRLGVSSTALLLIATVYAFVLANKPDPDYASPYDGQDPNAAGCVDAAVTTPIVASGPRVMDLQGHPVGHLELKASPKCGTVWAKIVLDSDVAPGLKGGLVVRCTDLQTAYALPTLCG
jgi:hypothetical protein